MMATARFKEFPVYDDEGNIIMKHYDDIGSGGPQVAASYEIALDPEFKDIIDATYFDTNHLKEWSSPLPIKDDIPGNYHTNLEKLYARGRIFCGRIPTNFALHNYATDEESRAACDATGTIFYSAWTEVAIGTQRSQPVTITDENDIETETSSEAIGLWFNR